MKCSWIFVKKEYENIGLKTFSNDLLIEVNLNKFDGRKKILAFSIILLSNSNSTSLAFNNDSNHLLDIKITGLHQVDYY